MAVDALDTAAASTQTTAPKSALSRSKLGESFDTFLVMLTTQLKHQDPLSPMDSTEFTNQLVQFANVEQQINANANLEKLINVNQTSQTAMAISYIGRSIEADSPMLPLQDGAEEQTNKIVLKDGKVTFNYQLANSANDAVIRIKDSNGNVVRSLTGLGTVGKHTMLWDGKSTEGTLAADGEYTIEVEAEDADGNPVVASTYAFSRSKKAGFSYTLAKDATQVQVVIKNLDGDIVRNLNGKTAQGRHEMEWDGRDSDGKDLPDGAYTLEVVATAGDKSSIDYVTTVYGRVTDVSSDDSGALLNMSGVVTTLDRVLTVRETAAVQSGSTSSPTSN